MRVPVAMNFPTPLPPAILMPPCYIFLAIPSRDFSSQETIPRYVSTYTDDDLIA